MAKVLIDIPDEIWESIKHVEHRSYAELIILKATKNGTPLPKGYGKLIDANVVKQKVFDITDLYDSGEYLVFEDGKYLIGDDIQNDNRRVLSFNEALQGVINGMPVIVEADEDGE